MPNRRQKPKMSYSDDNVNFCSLLEFVNSAIHDLIEAGDEDAALRFEIFYEYLKKDFKGGYLKYNSRALGL